MEDSAILLTTVQTKYELLRPLMDERMRRQWAAAEALSLKRGGVTVVSRKLRDCPGPPSAKGFENSESGPTWGSRMSPASRNFRLGCVIPAAVVIP
jgi:hypothetical protein